MGCVVQCVVLLLLLLARAEGHRQQRPPSTAPRLAVREPSSSPPEHPYKAWQSVLARKLWQKRRADANTPRTPVFFSPIPDIAPGAKRSERPQRAEPVTSAEELSGRQKRNASAVDFSHNSRVSNGRTTGEYRVSLPDGRIQIVTYSADRRSGFKADVRYIRDSPQPKAPVAGVVNQQNIRESTLTEPMERNGPTNNIKTPIITNHFTLPTYSFEAAGKTATKRGFEPFSMHRKHAVESTLAFGRRRGLNLKRKLPVGDNRSGPMPQARFVSPRKQKSKSTRMTEIEKERFRFPKSRIRPPVKAYLENGVLYRA